MLKIHNLHVRAGEFALDSVGISVPGKSYGVLMGRTGCGKTTLLEAICGLKRVDRGSIFIGEEEITGKRAGERGIGYLPQDVALFRHMTVREHFEFGPRVARWDRQEMDRQTQSLAVELGVSHLLGRKPRGLSGGEQQRSGGGPWRRRRRVGEHRQRAAEGRAAVVAPVHERHEAGAVPCGLSRGALSQVELETQARGAAGLTRPCPSPRRA